MVEKINHAESYQRALQKRYSENGLLHTQKLWNSPSNSLIKWVGAKTVKLPTLNVTAGRKDRQRRTITGFDVNYENGYQIFELENERYWNTIVDPLDVDESDYVLSIANITKVFNDQEKIPEMDKYMISKLFAEKKRLDTDGKGIVELTLNEENFLDTLDKLMLEMDEAQVPRVGRTLFVTPQIEGIIKRIKDFGRSINIQGGGRVIDRRIDMLDDVTIEPAIPSALMKTEFDFTEGAKDSPGSKQIEMILVHIPCMAAPVKYRASVLDSPSASNSMNWLYYEESYDDVFVFESKHEGLAFVIAETV